MATQLLFYIEVAAITAKRHSSWHMRAIYDFTFAKKVNPVPLMASEFMSALTEFAIIFAGDNETVLPVLLLGLRNSENIFVGFDGNWKGR